MRIRLAAESDARAVANIHVQTWQSAYCNIVSDTYLAALSIDKRETVWREAIVRGSPELWVAESESGVVGWVAFGPSRDHDATPTVGELEAIYIASAYWSTGTGRELWLLAQRRLLERGFTCVTLWVLTRNERAIRFYRAAGFTVDPTSEKDIHLGDQTLREIRYETALG